jgi:hypothetical protein
MATDSKEGPVLFPLFNRGLLSALAFGRIAVCPLPSMR